MNFEDYKEMRNSPLEDFATIHNVSEGAELFRLFESFQEARWAFRGQGSDRAPAAGIERVAVKPGVAEDFVMREFRRRAHQYVRDLPDIDDDLEWLALMQHHGAPTRLLDWTRSPHVAAFFAAESSNWKPSHKATAGDPVGPFTIWTVDTDKVNAEAALMLGLPENSDLSSRENFRRIYWTRPPEGIYLVAAVQPHRMNERLTIQQGVFLMANHVLFSFRDCLKGLLLHARRKHSRKWLHKIVCAPAMRLDVLSALDRVNISSATLFPGLDGFCKSLYVTPQIRETEDWPRVSQTSDREHWVKGAPARSGPPIARRRPGRRS